jgi:hypothetical protein
MFNRKVIFLLMMNVALFMSCDDNDIRGPRDYYPANTASVRYYEVEHYQPYTPGAVVTDTISVQYTGDTLIAGKTYHVETSFFTYRPYDGDPVTGKSVFRLTRKEGSRCYYIFPGTDGPELLMVDANAKVGDVYVFDRNSSGDFKTEQIVVATGTTHVIQGKRYDGVIELEEIGYWRDSNTGEFFKAHVQRRWFAPGIGEIYSAFETYYYTVGIRHFLLPA